MAALPPPLPFSAWKNKHGLPTVPSQFIWQFEDEIIRPERLDIKDKSLLDDNVELNVFVLLTLV